MNTVLVQPEQLFPVSDPVEVVPVHALPVSVLPATYVLVSVK